MAKPMDAGVKRIIAVATSNSVYQFSGRRSFCCLIDLHAQI